MSTVSVPLSDNARKISRLILQRLASVGQARVAVSCGVSESTVSRWKDEIDRVAVMLDALGCTLVDIDSRMVSAADLSTLLRLSRIATEVITPEFLSGRAGELEQE